MVKPALMIQSCFTVPAGNSVIFLTERAVILLKHLINITRSQDSHIKAQKWPTSGPMQINMFCFPHEISQSEGSLDDSHESSSEVHHKPRSHQEELQEAHLSIFTFSALVIGDKSLCYLKKKANVNIREILCCQGESSGIISLLGGCFEEKSLSRHIRHFCTVVRKTNCSKCWI